jgi:hypothetical protein
MENGRVGEREKGRRWEDETKRLRDEGTKGSVASNPRTLNFEPGTLNIEL